jgi:hypothetical protein
MPEPGLALAGKEGSAPLAQLPAVSVKSLVPLIAPQFPGETHEIALGKSAPLGVPLLGGLGGVASIPAVQLPAVSASSTPCTLWVVS